MTLLIVDNLDMFYDYPWSKICYQALFRSLGRGWMKKVEVAKNMGSKKMSYTLYDIFVAIQLHIYSTLCSNAEENEQSYVATIVLLQDKSITELDAISCDVVELQDALLQAQVDAKNDEAEDTNDDVNAEDSENIMGSEDSLDQIP
ncbi:hypothetical protein Fot_32048 [Forsythia ovata]|uniref:DUF1985 domain-containing protein n=1 Tax=Forsythia ovata TaxID=205694 RepID=A0ABD1T6P2_9LAMI